MQATPLIGFGQVRHTRARPKKHAFAYPTYFLMLPLRSLSRAARAKATIPSRPTANENGTEKATKAPPPWVINRAAPISFFETDHGDGRPLAQGGAIAWLDELLLREGIEDATGEVWLHCYPRVLGFTFKPVSFWYCHRAAHDQGGSLRAIVVEVNNTFGERHCYLLDAPRYGVEQRADKVFHVSPFNPVQGHYRFSFMRTQAPGPEKTVARIDYYDAPIDVSTHASAAVDNPALLQTSVSGTLEPISRAALRRALWRYPAMTLAVVAHIHLQAMRLWLKQVPYFGKPKPPTAFVSR